MLQLLYNIRTYVGNFISRNYTCDQLSVSHHYSLIIISTKNIIAAKKLRPRSRPEKGCDEKDVKSKGGS